MFRFIGRVIKCCIGIYLLVLFFGCMGTVAPIEMYDKYGVFLDQDYMWLNAKNGAFRKMTLKAVNTKYVDSLVEVNCTYGNRSFGSKKFMLRARSSKVFTISGIYSGVKLRCELKEI